MAENVTLNPTDTSGGAVIHTDELSSGAQVQRIKIGLGNPGVYSDVDAGNPFPVQVIGGTVVSDGGGSLTVDNAGTFAVQATQAGAWAVSDGAVVAALGGTLTVSGTVTANAGSGTQAVSLASVPSHNVTNAGTFAVQATQAGAWVVSDGAVVGALSSVTTAGAFRVNIDSSNISIGGGTEYSVGTALASEAGLGKLTVGIRDDALSTLTEVEGTVVPLRLDSTGALWVAAAPGDAETTDGATVHSLGVTRQVNVGFISQPNELTVGANTIGMAAMTETRAIHVSIKEDSVGIGGGTQYTEDAAAAANPVGNATILVRDDRGIVTGKQSLR